MSALNTTVWLTCGAVGEMTKSALGVATPLTDTVCDTDAERPRSLVTVSVTLNVAAVENACDTVWPAPVPPSPKFHANEVIADAPVPGVLADASNVTATP
jgi:hypothetical protein